MKSCFKNSTGNSLCVTRKDTKKKVLDIVCLPAKRGEVEEEKWRDSRAAHEIDVFTITSSIKNNLVRNIVNSRFSRVPLLPVLPHLYSRVARFRTFF